jgi:chromate reductase
MPHLLAFCGSLRAASSARATLRAIERMLDGRATMGWADIAALPHYDADLEAPEAVATLIDRIAAADGLIFVTPEYNYSIPGALKNAIDWASRPAMNSAFKGKRCLVATVSGGALGGVRAQAHLKYVLDGMLADPHRTPELAIPHAPKKVEDGVLADEATLAFLGKALDGFLAALAPAADRAA